MAFYIPRDQVLPVDTVEVCLDPAPHPFELANEAAITANWEREKRETPALFDGRVMLLASLAYRDRRLVGLCHAVRYATMLYWRKNRGAPGIEHSFAFAVLVSSDNALVAIRMGKHTANPRSVYFAAGSFEPTDFVDGKVDIHGNMAREVLEETGLDILKARPDRMDHIFSTNASTVVFRRYFLEDDAETLARRIEVFVASEVDPEIEGPVIIRSVADKPDGMARHMTAIIEWHFGVSAPTFDD